MLTRKFSGNPGEIQISFLFSQPILCRQIFQWMKTNQRSSWFSRLNTFPYKHVPQNIWCFIWVHTYVGAVNRFYVSSWINNIIFISECLCDKKLIKWDPSQRECVLNIAKQGTCLQIRTYKIFVVNFSPRKALKIAKYGEPWTSLKF